MTAASNCHQGHGNLGPRPVLTRHLTRAPLSLPQAPTSVLSPGAQSSAAGASPTAGQRFGIRVCSDSSFFSLLEVLGVGHRLTSTLDGGHGHQVEGTLAGATGDSTVCAAGVWAAVPSPRCLSDPPTGRDAALPLAAEGPEELPWQRASP